MPTALDKLAFDTAQAARVGWFFGQKLLAARLSRPVPLPDELRGRPMPDRRRILADLRALFEQDWRNIEAGYYAPPPTVSAGLLGGIAPRCRFFRRSRRGRGADATANAKERLLREPATRPLPALLPAEIPFSERRLSERRLGRTLRSSGRGIVRRRGGGDAAPGAGAVARGARRASRRTGAARRGCSISPAAPAAFCARSRPTGRGSAVTGLDLSPHYLAVARRALAPWSRIRLVEGAAEAMPFADGEFDVVTCIYLFHELPPRVRRAVAAEIGRVLRPGGTVIFVELAADR